MYLHSQRQIKMKYTFMVILFLAVSNFQTFEVRFDINLVVTFYFKVPGLDLTKTIMVISGDCLIVRAMNYFVAQVLVNTIIRE